MHDDSGTSVFKSKINPFKGFSDTETGTLVYNNMRHDFTFLESYQVSIQLFLLDVAGTLPVSLQYSYPNE